MDAVKEKGGQKVIERRIKGGDGMEGGSWE
jgi:hypothetical protein